MVLLGVMGETAANLTNWIKDDALCKWIEKASALVLILGLISELVSIRIGQIEMAAVTGEAGDAKTSAIEARIAADDARKKVNEVATQADIIAGRLRRASTQLSELEHDILIQGPRWKLLEAGKEDFIKTLKPFAGQKVLVVYCGQWASVPPELFRVAQDLMNFLGKNKGAGWDVNGSTWDSCTTGASSAGGNLISTSSVANGDVKGAANALYDALNKIEISTIKTEADPREAEPNSLTKRSFGAGSPRELAAKNPTSVILLVGTNPMLDLAGLKKRKK
jgi:hypothetical protein